MIRDSFELCPCLDSLFPKHPAEQNLQLVADLGFRGIEFWDWRERDVDSLADQSKTLGLKTVAFSGNTFSEPLLDPAAHEPTLDHLRNSVRVAHRLGVNLLVAHVGYAIPGRSRTQQWQAAVRGLREAGALASAEGIILAVEPLNSRRDHPGYFLDSLVDGARLVDEIGHEGVRLLLDVYHMAVMHDDLLARLPSVVPMTVHVHVADVPGRGEPGSGVIPWPLVLERLQTAGYRGAIGLECWPTTTPEAALRRSRQVLRA